MAKMVILEATEYPAAYYYKVHVDDTKLVQTAPAQVDEAGEAVGPALMGPDPLYVMEFNWGKDISLDVIKREMKLLCEHRLAELQGSRMADKGQTL